MFRNLDGRRKHQKSACKRSNFFSLDTVNEFGYGSNVGGINGPTNLGVFFALKKAVFVVDEFEPYPHC